MFAVVGVQTGVGEAQPLDRYAVEDVRLYDLFHIGLGDVPIPDCVGIDHDIRPVLALVEASSLIGAYFAFQSMLGEFLLEQFLKTGFGSWIATPSGMACGALIPAYEDMFFEFWHQATHWRTSSSVST